MFNTEEDMKAKVCWRTMGRAGRECITAVRPVSHNAFILYLQNEDS